MHHVFKFCFAGNKHLVAKSQDAIFKSSRKLAHPVETPRGPIEDPSFLQHLALFHLDLPAKFYFAGTLHLVAAS
jgi:hypothetical protein